DAIGRWREKETIQFNPPDGNNRAAGKRVDLPLETTGEVAGLAGSAFSDSKQLGRILAGNPVCQECIARQMFRYAYGRLENSSDQETIQRVFARFRDSGFHFKELMLAIVASPEFVRGLDHNSNREAARR